MRTTAWVLTALVAFSIFLSGCEATVPPTVFEPESTGSVFSFYQNGYALGAFKSDSFRVVAELEKSDIPIYPPCIRVWLLYYNFSNTPFFFDPLDVARLSVIQSDNVVNGIRPVPPYKVLSVIDNQKMVAMIGEAIGGVAASLQAKPTSITNTQTGASYQVNDRKEKQSDIIRETGATMANTSVVYDLYKQSIVEGILQRNTIFPKQVITGYLYFQVPNKFVRDSCNYELEIIGQGGKAVFDFEPAAGE